MQNFHIYSAFWGQHYVDMFKRCCFKSLNWPQNAEAIKGRLWNIYTKSEHFEELTALFKDSSYHLQLIDMRDGVDVAGVGRVPMAKCDSGVILLHGLRNQIAFSIQNKSKMLLAPPDTIFGDGTVPNLLKIGVAPGACVSVAHPRVLPDIIDELEFLGATRGAVSNAQLVTLAMKNAHDSWKFGEVGHPKNNSYVGGITWQELSTGLYSVQHRLPTPYFVDFNPTDFDFFWGQVSWGGWDHRWPAENLIRQERQRYVGSSDACFIVEVTDWDKNVPQEIAPQAREQIQASGQVDMYWNSHYHNGINRQVNVIWRGE